MTGLQYFVTITNFSRISISSGLYLLAACIPLIFTSIQVLAYCSTIFISACKVMASYHARTHTYAHTHPHTHVDTRSYTCMLTYICTHTRSNIQLCTFTHKLIRTHITNTLTCTNIHVYAHTYMLTPCTHEHLYKTTNIQLFN